MGEKKFMDAEDISDESFEMMMQSLKINEIVQNVTVVFVMIVFLILFSIQSFSDVA